MNSRKRIWCGPNNWTEAHFLRWSKHTWIQTCLYPNHLQEITSFGFHDPLLLDIVVKMRSLVLLMLQLLVLILLKSYLIYHILIGDTDAGMLWVRTSCLIQLAAHICQHRSEIRTSTSQNLCLMNCSWHLKWYSSCNNSTNVHNRNATQSSSMFVFSLGLRSAVSFLSNGCNDHHLCGIVGKVIVHLQTSAMWKQTTPSEKEIKK